MTKPVHPLVMETVRILKSRGQTVSFAESCTGGLLSAVFTHMPGVSGVFAGSIVAYSYPVKEALLGVPAFLLRTHGAVSVPVARVMAEGVHQRLHTTWALSITGIAGPGGGTSLKPVGTVCFALVGPGVVKAVTRRFTGDRRQIQGRSARFALRMLLHALENAGQNAGVNAEAPVGIRSKSLIRAQVGSQVKSVVGPTSRIDRTERKKR